MIKPNSPKVKPLQKFKSFREQPVKIIIDPLESQTKKHLDTNDMAKNQNSKVSLTNKSGLKSALDDAEDFESAEDSDAMDIRASALKASSPNNTLFNHQIIFPNRVAQSNNISKKQTIQEVSEDVEMNDTNQNLEPIISLKVAPRDCSKITEEAKDADAEEVEFKTSELNEKCKHCYTSKFIVPIKKPLVIPKAEDDDLREKPLTQQYNEIGSATVVGLNNRI